MFDAFIAQLRADPQVDDGACDRLEAALAPGKTINAANLHDALFPKKDGGAS